MRIALIVALGALLWLTGCASSGTGGGGFWGELAREMQRDPRDAPWDPEPGRQLFEQIPAWDRAAEKICCGHLRSCQPHQSPRC